MARHNQAIASIHRIIQRNAYTQALFFFVDGAISQDNRISPREAIFRFQERYDIPGLDIECEVTAYNRMRSEYLTENKVFQNGQNNGNAPDKGHSDFLRKSMGVVGQ